MMAKGRKQWQKNSNGKGEKMTTQGKEKAQGKE